MQRGPSREKPILASSGSAGGCGESAPRGVMDDGVESPVAAGAVRCPWYLAARRGEGAWLALGSGLFVTILLGAYLLASARHTAEVEGLGEEFTQGLPRHRAQPCLGRDYGYAGRHRVRQPQVHPGHRLRLRRGTRAESARPQVRRDAPGNVSATLGGHHGRERVAGGVSQQEEERGALLGGRVHLAGTESGRPYHPLRGGQGRHHRAEALEEAARIRTHQLEAIRAVTAEITRELDLMRFSTCLLLARRSWPAPRGDGLPLGAGAGDDGPARLARAGGVAGDHPASGMALREPSPRLGKACSSTSIAPRRTPIR